MNTKLASLLNINIVIDRLLLLYHPFVDHLHGQGGEYVGTYDYSLFCIINTMRMDYVITCDYHMTVEVIE